MLRTLALRFSVALVAATVLMGAMVVVVNRQLDSKVAGIDRVDLTTDTTPRPAKAGNYLIVGSDSRAFVGDDPDAAASFGEEGGERSDTLMIAHVEPETPQVTVVSIPRDTAVDLPDGGRSKITDVFNDGPQALIDVIGSNFDVPITHYLNIDFAGFDRIVDLVGPVTVHFPYAARDQKTGLEVLEPGCMPLEGDQALAYVRSRAYQELIDGTWTDDQRNDFGRIERQQAFLRQLAVLARDEIYSSPLDIPGIVDAALATVQADDAFGRDQILGFIDRFRDVDPYDPSTVEMVTLPTVAGPAGTSLGSFLEVDRPDAEVLLDRLRTFGAEAGEGPTAPVGDVAAPDDEPPGDGPSGSPPLVSESSEAMPGPLPDAIPGAPGEPLIPVCS